MKIYQGIKSEAMRLFEFMEMHKLNLYSDKYEPVVLFGCYSKEDVAIVENHKGTIVVQWEGLDSKMHKDLSPFLKGNVINVSPHKNIVNYFAFRGLKCYEIKWAINETIHPQKLGTKVYSYVNRNNPRYYGSDLIRLLKTKHKLLVADNTVKQDKFKGVIRNTYYNQVFIGLQLSTYAGGGFGIVELGLRGIKVVTNVLDLPHTVKWDTVKGIDLTIEKESEKIGTVNKELAEQVYESVLCFDRIECYDLDQLIK